MISRYSRPVISKIWSEQNKFQKMLDVELAICKAWHQMGVIPQDAYDQIISKASFQVDRINEIEQTTQHDVIAFVTNVAENIGDAGRYVHLGATSSDILDTGLALQMKEAGSHLMQGLQSLQSSLQQKALQYKDTPVIGRTHGIHAEPTSFGLKFALWYYQMQNNVHRLQNAIEEISVGKLSGAVGNFANTRPEIEDIALPSLGLRPALVATQVVSRDVHALFLMTTAIIAGTLESIATEIRHLQRTEVSEAKEPFGSGQKGSSAMPHKRNPIICERICGLSRMIRHYAGASIENIALWHERDISHSSAERVLIPDATILLDYILYQTNQVVSKLDVFPEQMMINITNSHGLYASQRILTKLIEKGMQREEAYALIQKGSFEALRTNQLLSDFLQNEPLINSKLTSEEREECFDIQWYLRHVDHIYRRVGLIP